MDEGNRGRVSFLFLFQGEQYIDRKGAALGTEGDGTAVFADDGCHALGAEAVIPGVAGGDGAAIFHGDCSFIEVAGADGQQFIVAADGQVDGAQAGIQRLHGVDGVFQEIPEQRIDVGILHEA